MSVKPQLCLTLTSYYTMYVINFLCNILYYYYDIYTIYINVYLWMIHLIHGKSLLLLWCLADDVYLLCMTGELLLPGVDEISLS